MTHAETSAQTLRDMIVERLDAYIDRHRADPTHATLWTMQFTVFEAIRDAVAAGRLSGYVKLPPGSGKTVLFIALAEALGLPTLIPVPTGDLVEQTIRQLTKFAPGLDVGRIDGRAKDAGHLITVTTYSTYAHLDCAPYACIYFDEARALHGPTRKRTLATCGHAFRIGFDATPDYAQRKRLADLLGPAYYEMTIAEAIAHGMLCDYRTIPVRVRTDISGVRMAGQDFDERAWDAAIDSTALIEAAAQLYAANHAGERAIVFCGRIPRAEKAAARFGQTAPASTFHGKLRPAERAAALATLASGKRPVLCAAQLADCGIDEPKLRVGFMVRGTASPVVAEQRGGRLLRLDPDDPNKVATIYEFVFADEAARQVTFAEVAGGATSLPPGSTSERAAQRRRATTPRTLPTVEGLTVVTEILDADALVRDTIERRERRHAPPGWMTRPEFARRTGASPAAASALIDALSAAHPEAFTTRTDGAGRTTVYGAPTFMEALIERMTRYPRTNDAIPLADAARILNVPAETLRRTFYPRLASHPRELLIGLDGTSIMERLHATLVTRAAERLGRGPALHLYRIRRSLEERIPALELASRIIGFDLGDVFRALLRPLAPAAPQRRRKRTR